MKRAKELLKAMQLNGKILTVFEIIYKVVSFAFFIPFFWFIFDVIMRITGYPYLTAENLKSFLSHPLTIFYFIVCLVVVAVYLVIDLSAVLFLINQGIKGVKVSLFQTLVYSVRNVKRIFCRKNILLLIAMIPMLLLFYSGLAAGYFSTVSIPRKVKVFLRSIRVFYPGIAVGMACLFIWAMHTLIAFFYFTLEKCDYREAVGKSVRLRNRRKLFSLAVILLLQAAGFLLYIGLVGLMVLISALLRRIFSETFFLNVMSATALWGKMNLSLFIAFSLMVPLCGSAAYMLFRSWRGRDGKDPIYSELPPPDAGALLKKLFRKSRPVLVIILVAGIFILAGGMVTGRINPQIEFLRTVEVTAHRGASASYPENTMAAFEGAVEAGADWIELDVQQSKDGKIFVMHDTNFRRTTGLDEYSWNLTYGEIAALDAGSFFSSAFAGERIPLLSDVIEFAKEKGVYLNIELKPTGYEKDFEKTVVDVITEHDFEDQCVITSQVYEVLERIKEYKEDMFTVYVMGFAYGNINKLTAADNFSVNSNSVTSSLVKRVHNAGKQLYVWTVNTRKGVGRMVDLNVDNIITDRITMAKDYIYESKASMPMNEYMELVEELSADIRSVK